MIGYNIEEINTLMKTLADSYKTLGETMATGWDTVSSTLGTEWIGPDEVSFETELATRMQTLYYSCRESVIGMIGNIREVGLKWQEFQNSNLLQGVTAVMTSAYELIVVNPVDYQIEQYVKPAERTFSANTRMGVANGDQSADTINKAVVDYVNAIGESVKSMYEGTSSSAAFIGEGQSSVIDEYLTKMATAFSKVVTQVQDMQTALVSLVKKYNEQMQSFAKDVSKIDTNITAGQNEASIHQVVGGI